MLLCHSERLIFLMLSFLLFLVYGTLHFRVAVCDAEDHMPLHEMTKSQRFPCVFTRLISKDSTWVPGGHGRHRVCFVQQWLAKRW